MRVDQLKELLGMYPNDMEVFVQTVPNDLCSPVSYKHLSLIKAYQDERYGLQEAKLVFTAYHPDRETTLPQEKGLKAAREVFDLLYPLLDEFEKQTSEATKAREIVCYPKYL